MMMMLLLVVLLVVTLILVQRHADRYTPLGNTKRATVTVFESYPTSSKEGKGYSGDEWEGYFKGVRGKKSRGWVKSHNIAAVHSQDYERYANKWLRVIDTRRRRMIDVHVVDMCYDIDVEKGLASCSKNRRWKNNNFLIDLEKHTAERFIGKKLRSLGEFGMQSLQFQVIPRPKYLRGARF